MTRHYRPAQVREIAAASSALATGWTTEAILRAAACDMNELMDEIVRAADAKRRKRGHVEPDPFDPKDAPQNIKLASVLLFRGWTTPEHLAGVVFAHYPEDAARDLIIAADKTARAMSGWSMYHPNDPGPEEPSPPKSRADRDADILGRPRPLDPRRIDADAPARPESALDRAMQDPAGAALIDKLKALASAEPTYENVVLKTAALAQLLKQPEGHLIIAELQRQDAGGQDRANAEADAARHAYLLEQARLGVWDDRPKNTQTEYDQ